MKKTIALFLLVFLIFSCSIVEQSKIGSEMNKEILINQTNQDTTFAQVISSIDDSQLIMIDIWASWCPDCIRGLDEMKQIQKIYTGKNITYLFLSVDEDAEKWKNAIQKFEIVGKHYLIKNGWKTSEFCKYLSVDWIPRYLLVNTKGEILHFYSKSASNKALIEAINKNIKR